MKRIFAVLASMVFGVCNTYCSHAVNRPAGDYYRGDPNTRHASLYLYLCRKGCDPTEKKCACIGCCGDKTGLSIGFICVDEANGERFDGIGPSTSNLLWSMHVAFFDGVTKGCHTTGKLTASYCYNPRIYSQVEALTVGGSIQENPDFLHEENGAKCEEINEKGMYRGGEELSAVHILRTALFRVKFLDMGMITVSDMLRGLGSIGEKRRIEGQDYQTLVPYSYLGIAGHNCATFCRQAMNALTPLPTIKWHLRPVPTVFGFAGTIGGGAAVGTAIFPIVGTIVGAAAGALVGGGALGVNYLVQKAITSAPESVIDMILDYFQEQYEKGDDDDRRMIDSFFSVVAQDRAKVEQYVRRTQAAIFDPNDYRELEYKTMEDVIAAGTRISKAKGKLFFKEDFEEKSDGGCSIM